MSKKNINKKNHSTNSNPFLPSDTVRTLRVGSCYNNITKEFVDGANVFDERALATNLFLRDYEGNITREFMMISKFDNTTWAQEIGLGVEAKGKFQAIKVGAEYNMSVASASATNNLSLTGLISNLYNDRIIKLDNYISSREELLLCLQPSFASDLNDMVGERNPAKKFAKYLTFINTYGHGCVVQIKRFAGCFITISFDFSDDSSSKRSKHDVKVGAKSITGKELNVAASWAYEEEQSSGMSKYGIKEVIMPASAEKDLGPWCVEMKTYVKEEIEYLKGKITKRPELPKTPWKPEYKKIEPFSKKEKEEYQQKRLGQFKTAYDRYLKQGKLFRAYRLMLLAKSEGAQGSEFEATLAECLQKINEKWDSIFKSVGEGEQLSVENIAFLDNYAGEGHEQEVNQLLEAANDIQVNLPAFIEDEAYLSAYDLVGKLLKMFETSDYLKAKKTDILGLLNDKYGIIKERVNRLTEITTSDKKTTLNFLGRYYHIVEKSQREDVTETIATVNRLPVIPDKVQIALPQSPAFPIIAVRAMDNKETMNREYLEKQKIQDGYPNLELKKYIALLDGEISRFSVNNTVEDFREMEEDAGEYMEEMTLQPTDMVAKESKEEGKETGFITYDYELKTWDKIFPNYFELNFRDSLTGINVEKLMVFHQTRMQFLQYLHFFSSLNVETINFGKLHEKYSSLLNDTFGNLLSLLNKDQPITNDVLAKFAINNYNHIDNPQLKMVYDCFFKNYGFFNSAKFGFRLVIPGNMDVNVTDLVLKRENGEKMYCLKSFRGVDFSKMFVVYPKMYMKGKELHIGLQGFNNSEKGIVPVSKVVLAEPVKDVSSYDYLLTKFELPIQLNEQQLIEDLDIKINTVFKRYGYDSRDYYEFEIDQETQPIVFQIMSQTVVKQNDPSRGFPMFH